jgi:hypothetical protein
MRTFISLVNMPLRLDEPQAHLISADGRVVVAIGDEHNDRDHKRIIAIEVAKRVNLHGALVAAVEAAEHWLQAEADCRGQRTVPDEILRVLRAVLAKVKTDV